MNRPIEPTCVEAARAALEAFPHGTHGVNSEPIEAWADSVADLLSDLRLFCASEGLDFAALDERAAENAAIELDEVRS